LSVNLLPQINRISMHKQFFLGLISILSIVSSFSQSNYYFDKITTDQGLSNNTVSAIMQDRYGRMWFGTYDGLNCYDGSAIRTFGNIATNLARKYTDNQINIIHEDTNGIIWIVHPNGIISSLEDFESSRFQSYRLVPSNISINKVTDNSDGSISLSGINGGFVFNKKAKAFVFKKEMKMLNDEPVLLKIYKNDQPHLKIQKYWTANDNTIMIATLKDGLIKLTPTVGNKYRVETIRQLIDNPFSLSNNEVYSVFTDKSGITWIGTKDGGLNKLLPQAQFLKTLRYRNGKSNTLPKGTIRAISEDSKGKIWIGTYTEGVAIYNPKTETYSYLKQQNNSMSEDWDRIRCIYQTSDKRMWIGSYNGLCAIDPNNGNKSYFTPGREKNSLISGRIYSLAEDKKGFLWIGSWGGVDKLELKTGKITRVLSKRLSDLHVRKIMFDLEENLWIGTEFGGINKFNPATNQLEILKCSSSENSLSNNSIYSIYQAQNGFVWIGTSDGLNVFNPLSGEIERISFEKGLSAGLIMGILEDNDANVWLSTSRGVAKIDHKTRFIRFYDKFDGWVTSEFSEGAYFKNIAGELFFGGIDGITCFNPKQIPVNSTAPNFFIEIKSPKGRKGIISNATLKQNSTITVPYNQRNLQIEIQAFHYLNPGKNQIAYQFSSIDPSWHIVNGSKAEFNVIGLKPGIRKLQIKVSNADGVWSKTIQIPIHIEQPFWMKTWYWLSFIIAGFLISIVFVRVRLSQEKTRNARLQYMVEERTKEIEAHRLQLEIKNRELELVNQKTLKQKDQILAQHEHLLELHEKLKEINELKLNFFTNVSHEIRTPLTLILGPVENLLLGGELDNSQMDQLFLVQQQTNYLLSLVNQLLDYRKLENGSIALENEPGEFISFCRNICHTFLFEVHSRNIHLSFQSEIEALQTMFDGEKVRQIISNLISNALKFTPESGEIKILVKVSLFTQQILVQVEDNGIGIPSNRLGFIFDRFYQVGKSINPHMPGTGIGLSLALELAKIHQGSLSVKSEEGKGSIFTLSLPLVPVKTGINESSIVEPSIYFNQSLASTDQSISNTNVKQATILVVEDHPEVLTYIGSLLQKNYLVLLAPNAKEGLKLLKHQHVDIIISDWLMPEMDGMEFCRKVKQNKQYMHIPFMMVTALTGNNDHIQALECGADDYIKKPFSPQLLKVKLANLLQRENALKESISIQERLVPENKKEETEDEKMLKKFSKTIDENLSRSEFSPELLGELMGLSKMQLYRRVKQLTGLAPNELIQSKRLKRAKQLLEDTAFTISEVGYKVGFNDPKYFSKCFYRTFGVLPSQFQDAFKQQNEEVEY